MAERKIDYDRGVLIRAHSTGMEIFMYRDEPGVYYNANAGLVPVQFAKEAGFDTETHLREKLRGERLSQAAKLIDAELDAPTRGAKAEEVLRVGRYTVLRIPKTSRHYVQDADGMNLTPGSVLDFDTAKRVAEGLAAAEKETVDADVHATPDVSADERDRPANGGHDAGAKPAQLRPARAANKA